MGRVVTLLEDPIVRRPSTSHDREFQIMVVRLAEELALLQAETGSRSPENIISVAVQSQVIDKRYRDLKAVSDGKRSLRIFLEMFAFVAAWNFIQSGSWIELTACLALGHICARWRI